MVDEAQRARVLVVEDDPMQRELVVQLLTMSGYNVDEASDPAQAKAALASVRPDVIILDLHLPVVDGLTGLLYLRELQEDPATQEIPVIVVSSDESEETYILCLSSGASEFLKKPLRLAELNLRIQNALELTRARKALEAVNARLEGEKRRLLRYFSEDLVQGILSEQISAELGGEILEATILFMDIRNSTAIAEKYGARKFAELISMIFTDVMDLIFSNKGSINKLMGDGLLATFGCPVPKPEEDASNAVWCARQIREYFGVIGQMKNHAGIEEELKFGIGIATGRVFAGNIGSFRRMEYAVMGDPVNTASRLQELSKSLETDIVIDGTTRARLPAEVNVHQSEVRTIRGRTGELEIFTLS